MVVGYTVKFRAITTDKKSFVPDSICLKIDWSIVKLSICYYIKTFPFIDF